MSTFFRGFETAKQLQKAPCCLNQVASACTCEQWHWSSWNPHWSLDNQRCLEGTFGGPTGPTATTWNPPRIAMTSDQRAGCRHRTCLKPKMLWNQNYRFFMHACMHAGRQACRHERTHTQDTNNRAGFIYCTNCRVHQGENVARYATHLKSGCITKRLSILYLSIIQSYMLPFGDGDEMDIKWKRWERCRIKDVEGTKQT